MKKMLLNILYPWVYEDMEDLPMDEITYLPYPDPTPGSSKIWDLWGGSSLWRNSRCIGINYLEEFKKHGLDIDDFERKCSYTLTGRSWEALKADLDTNYKDRARYEFWGKIPESTDKEVTVSEFQVRSDQTSFLAVNIPIDSFEMNVLPCRSLGTFEIEVPDQAAVDYYTSSGFFVTSQDEWQEILDGAVVPDKVRGISFKEGAVLGRWEGVMYDSDEPRYNSPWIEKLENLKIEIDKILKKKMCLLMKGKYINSLIKKYYANL